MYFIPIMIHENRELISDRFELMMSSSHEIDIPGILYTA